MSRERYLCSPGQPDHAPDHADVEPFSGFLTGVVSLAMDLEKSCHTGTFGELHVGTLSLGTQGVLHETTTIA